MYVSLDGAAQLDPLQTACPALRARDPSYMLSHVQVHGTSTPRPSHNTTRVYSEMKFSVNLAQ